MALNYYSFQFGSFVFGGAGSVYKVLDVDGLESLPALRTQDDFKGANDGSFSGRDYLAPREISMLLNVFAGDGNSAQQNYQLLQAALNYQQQGTTTMLFQLSPTDSQNRIDVRLRGRKTSIDPEYTYGLIRAQITMFAPDPRYYLDSLQTVTLTPPSGSVGRVYDRSYDVSYGGGTNVSTATIPNTGWVYSSPTITITGPAINPVVGNVTTNDYITFAYTMSSTDTIVIDLNTKSVTLNGSSARNLVANGSDWFVASPGSDTFSFGTGGGTSGSTNAVITWRSAFV